MTKINLDCLNLIINELRTDKNSLYSCLLVNKEWCNLVVLILWKNHSFRIKDMAEREKKLYTTILSCLPSSSKNLLSNNNIKLPSTILLKSPLFNYISVCEFPKAEIIGKIVEILFEEELGNYERNILEQEIYKLFVSQCKGIKELCWDTSQPLPLFPGALTCFSQLHSLHIDVNIVSSNDLNEMARICKSLNKLAISNFSQDLPGLISLIDAQSNLESVSLYPDIKGTCEELSKALARKGTTINDLHLGPIGAIPPSFLTSLIKLKNITIYDSDNIRDEIKDFQHHLAISEFPDLQTITIVGLSCFKELAILIEKTNGNISYISIYTYNRSAENTGMLIKAIANKCPKIKCLPIYLVSNDFIHIKSLLLNCRNLEDIKFYGLDFVNDDDNIGDELLDILTKFSPNSLTKILISGGWKYSIDAFERFFESCRERTL
ncbi:hypothetical protein C1645_786335, partial [Glomus cerebriforme]